VFPYYGYDTDSIDLFINDNNEQIMPVNSNTDPEEYSCLKNIITGKSPNPIELTVISPILVCYQYYSNL
jgi:hypothetical protein